MGDMRLVFTLEDFPVFTHFVNRRIVSKVYKNLHGLVVSHEGDTQHGTDGLSVTRL